MVAGAWYERGVEPEHGKVYEFEDFVGARFIATFDRYEIADLDDGDGKGLRLFFLDRASVATNLPIRFRDAETVAA